MRRIILLVLAVLLAIGGGSAFAQMGRGPVGPAIPTMSGQSGKVLTNNGSVASWSTLAGIESDPVFLAGKDDNRTMTIGNTGSATKWLTSGALLAWVKAFFAPLASPTFTGTVTAPLVNWAKGADIASATTTNLCTATGNVVDVTGTTTITGFGTCTAGVTRFVRFTGALNLTYNAASMILPGSRNVTTEAGDRAIFVSLGSGNWMCHEFLKASGRALGDQIITSHSATENVTAISMYGNTHLVTGAYVVTLPAAVIGMSGIFQATTAAVFSVDVQAADSIVLAGTALTAGNKASSDGFAGSFIKVTCTSANTWRVTDVGGLFIDGGV